MPASNFSCYADRPDRRPGRSRAAIRKALCSAKRAYWPINRPLTAKSRTTTLGPFGEVVRQTGPMAKANPIRFSTKYDDDESGLCYYGYRYYDAIAGRWLGRDPIGESGGANLYAFTDNDAAGNIDALGNITEDAIRQKKSELENKYKNKCCSDLCSFARPSIDLKGYPGGSGNPETVIGMLTSDLGPCVAEVHYYWWTCYAGSAENPETLDPHLYGWEAYDGTKYSYSAFPGLPATINWAPKHGGDPLHIDMEAEALVVICYEGKYAVLNIYSKGLQWTWLWKSPWNGQWAGPKPEPGAIGQRTQ